MKLVLPGLIDPHVHLRDPGETYKEDFYTGSSAALAGGFTTILDMPNNKIPITTEKRLSEKIKIASQKTVCDIGFYFGSIGDNSAEFPKVINNVFGLKLYLNQTTGNFLVNEKKLESIFSSWALSSKSKALSLILVHAEDKMLSMVINLMNKLGNKVHVCHVSSKQDLQQIIKAKQNNLKITCGVTPHHLFLTDKDIKRLQGLGLMKPELGTQKDQDFLWSNLKYIDVIESDHAPHTKKEKGSSKKFFGVPNLETTLPLLLNATSDSRFAIGDVIRLCHTNPARIFYVPTDPNTKIEIDGNSQFAIRNSNLHTKCGWSPFEGLNVKGKVEKVILRGRTVFENGKILAKPGTGKILKPMII
jgi:dihydroorotase